LIEKKYFCFIILGLVIILTGIVLFSSFAQESKITLNDGTIINLPVIEFEPSSWLEKEIEKKDFSHYTFDVSTLSFDQQKKVTDYIQSRADQIYLTGQYSRLIEEIIF